MASLIGTAGTAAALAGAATFGSEAFGFTETEEEKPPARHWSQSCLIAGTVVAAVAGVAAVFFAQYVFAGGFCLMAVSQVIGAYYLKEFLPLRSLEGTVEKLAKKGIEMTRNRKEMERLNQSLKREKEQLAKLLDEDEKIIQEFEKKLKKQTAMLKTISQEVKSQLELSQKAFDEQKSLQEKSEKAMMAVSENTLQIACKQKELSNQTGRLEAGIDKLGALSLQAGERHVELSKTYGDFQGQLRRFQQIHQEMAEGFKQQAESLKRANLARQIAAESLKTTTGDIKKVVAAMRPSIFLVHRLNELLIKTNMSKNCPVCFSNQTKTT